jgi:hypothetical protein
MMLSTDSLFGQRTVFSVCVHGFDLFVDGGFETVCGFEGLVGEVMALEGFPFVFDVIQFRGIFGQPFRLEPMLTRGERITRGFACMDRAVVEHDGDGLRSTPGLTSSILGP